MFNGCSALEEIYCHILYPTGPTVSDYFEDWVADVAASGTFYKTHFMDGVSGANWASGANGIPANWSVEDLPVYSE